MTYHLANLHPAIPATSDVVIATRVTDPRDLQVLTEIAKLAGQPDDWRARLGGLAVQEAVLVKDADQTDGLPRQFVMAPRLSGHVRHRQKYVAVGVTAHHAFVFTRDGVPTGECAYSLAEFVAIVRASAPDLLDGHLRRSDFSQWIVGVFGDHQLAAEIRQLEQTYRQHPERDARGELVQAIVERYAMRQEESGLQPTFD